jgi:hypothetical protein
MVRFFGSAITVSPFDLMFAPGHRSAQVYAEVGSGCSCFVLVIFPAEVRVPSGEARIYEIEEFFNLARWLRVVWHPSE